MDHLVTDTTGFGALFRERRKALGYIQVQVAALCGAGVRFISDRENGKPTTELVKDLFVRGADPGDRYRREDAANLIVSLKVPQAGYFASVTPRAIQSTHRCRGVYVAVPPRLVDVRRIAWTYRSDAGRMGVLRRQTRNGGVIL